MATSSVLIVSALIGQFFADNRGFPGPTRDWSVRSRDQEFWSVIGQLGTEDRLSECDSFSLDNFSKVTIRLGLDQYSIIFVF